MIDTVNLSIVCPMHSAAEMTALGFSSTCGHGPSACRHRLSWMLNPPASFSLPRITWTEGPDGLHWLSTSLSLPKMLFGSNVYTLQNDDDVSRGLAAVSQFVSECAGRRFDAMDANVNRVDFCHNWQLTPGEVCEYLQAVGRSTVPRMTRSVIDDETVQFSNNSHAIVLYDKFQEVMARMAKGCATPEELEVSRGILRLENRFLKHRSCQSLANKLNLPDMRAKSLLKSSVAESMIDQTLQCLGLNNPIHRADARLARLRECYGFTSEFFALAGFLVTCDKYGDKNMIALGMPRATYYRKRKAVQRAGAWLMPVTSQSLPPLDLENRKANAA